MSYFKNALCYKLNNSKQSDDVEYWHLYMLLVAHKHVTCTVAVYYIPIHTEFSFPLDLYFKLT